MSFVMGTTSFFIAAGETLAITSAINGNTAQGGDYVGPLVVVGVPDRLQQSVFVTTTRVRFISRDSNGLTSRTVYDYSVTNHSNIGLVVRFDKSFDG